jgi:hypothetical protein
MNMKLKRLILACLILSLFGITPRSSAQDGYPKTLNPADVLAEGVELVQRLPVVSFDIENRVLYYSDGTTWTAYPYPPDQPMFTGWSELSDGVFLLSSSASYDEGFAPAYNFTLYDSRSGVFTQPEAVCDVMKDQPGMGGWGFYRDSDNLIWLCSTETGKVSKPLPAALQPNLCGDIRNLMLPHPEESPDDKWLVFWDCNSPDFSLYSYEIATEKLTYLGTNKSSDGEDIEVERWVDNTHPVILGKKLGEPTHPYDVPVDSRTWYVADLTAVNSLQKIVTDPTQVGSLSVYYFDNPPRYEWVPGDLAITGSPPTAEECSRHIFDLRTLTLTVEKPLPDNCGMGVAVGDGTGDRLYRNVSDDNTGLATLIRFNFETGASRKLFTGKTAWIDSVSPGGQYAQLTLSEEQRSLPNRWFVDRQNKRTDLKTPDLRIVDMHTGRVAFETPLEIIEDSDGIHKWLTPDFQWASGSTFILADTQYDKRTDQGSETYRLVQLTGEGHTQRAISLSNSQLLTIQHPGILWVSSEDGTKAFWALADPVSKRFFPVTRAYTSAEYRAQEYSVDVRLRKDRLVEVTIIDEQRSDQNYDNYDLSQYHGFILHRWLVRVPGFSYF